MPRFITSRKAKQALAFAYRTIRLHECRNPPSSHHRPTHRVAIGNHDAWSAHTSLPTSRHRPTHRVAIGNHDGWSARKKSTRKLDFAFLRLYLCSAFQFTTAASLRSHPNILHPPRPRIRFKTFRFSYTHLHNPPKSTTFVPRTIKTKGNS